MGKYNRFIMGMDGTRVVVDVYAVLSAFEVHSPALQHAIKKLLMPGVRGAKTRLQDLIEAQQALDREIQIAQHEYHAAEVAKQEAERKRQAGEHDLLSFLDGEPMGYPAGSFEQFGDLAERAKLKKDAAPASRVEAGAPVPVFEGVLTEAEAAAAMENAVKRSVAREAAKLAHRKLIDKIKFLSKRGGFQ